MDLLVVFSCFFLSGTSGLIFETIWTRMFVSVFGATSLSISTIIATFMGGLALGSWLFGKIADRIKMPVLTYAIAELGVGIYAVVVPLIVDGVYPGINRWLWNTFHPMFFTFSLIRFALVALVLLIPTTLMGATLPLLARHFVQRPRAGGVSMEVGRLYAINTFGAVFGTFMAGFVLLPAVGLAWTNRIAGVINISLALAIFGARHLLIAGRDLKKEVEEKVRALLQPARALAIGAAPWLELFRIRLTLPDLSPLDALREASMRRMEKIEPPKPAPVPSPVVAKPAASRERVGPPGALIGRFTDRHLVLVALALSGASSMIYQVVWNRALAMVLGSSIYSFTIILLAFLVGLALGSAIISALMKQITNPMLAFGIVQLLIGVSAAGNYVYQDDLPILFAKAVTQIEHFENHVGMVQFMGFLIAGLAILPATLGMGATFPLAVRIWSAGGPGGGADAGKTVGADVGVVYSINTVGAIVGSFLAGFVLMPFLQMQNSFFIAVGANLVLAMVCILAAPGDDPLKYIVTPAIPIAATIAFLFTPRWDLTRMTLGVFRVSLAEDIAQNPDRSGSPDLVYYRDGMATTVSVERYGNHFALKNNGKVDASNGDDMPTQVMVAGYPLMLHPRGPEGLDLAVIGFGSGTTIGTALQFPVRRVDAIELEKWIPQASQYFSMVNHLQYPLQRFPFVRMPRLNVINNDGRNYLASTNRMYDIIISEPSNPWITGVSNLFTVEHFRAASRRLRPGGIFCQWIQLYEMSPDRIKTIFRTFAEVFPHVIVFAAEDLSSDTVVLGSFDPLPLDLGRARRAWAHDRVPEALEPAYIFSPFDIFGRVLIANHDEMMDYTAGAVLNTDDNAVVEFNAPRDLIGYRRYESYLSTIYGPEWPYGQIAENIAGFGEGPEQAENYAQLAMSLVGNGKKALAATFVARSKQALRGGESATAQLVLDVLRLFTERGQEPGISIEPPMPAADLAPELRQSLDEGFSRARAAIDRSSFSGALEAIEQIAPAVRNNAGSAMRMLHGYLLFKASEAAEQGTQYDRTIEVLEELIRQDEDYVRSHPAVYYYLARAHDAELNYDKATRNMRRFVELRQGAAGAPSAPGPTVPSAATAVEGDFVAAAGAGGRVRVYRILRKGPTTTHVAQFAETFATLDEAAEAYRTKRLHVVLAHSPIPSLGFARGASRVLGRLPLTDADLAGYRAYLDAIGGAGAP